jgi:hypothetical protein
LVTSTSNPKATTDAEGRFRITGIGRNRLVIARLEGPNIVTQDLHILTRPGKTIEATAFEGRPEMGDPRRVTTYYAPGFRHATSPSRPVVGIVRDRDTKKLLAGVSIRNLKLANNPLHYGNGQEIMQTTTDAQGRYRLASMPKGEGNKIKIVPPSDLPYLTVSFDVPNPPGLGPVTVDVALKRGVWIEGKVTDKVTGKPVKGGVHYFPLYSRSRAYIRSRRRSRGGWFLPDRRHARTRDDRRVRQEEQLSARRSAPGRIREQGTL